MAEEKAMRGASRYDAFIATFVGVCALCVSGYTAYMQRQQVRAAVWPILQFDSSNGPIGFTLANKGVGPAIIKHVIVRVDGEPIGKWVEVLNKFGAEPHYSESDMTGRVLSAGEKMDVFTPHANDQPISFDRSNPGWAKLNQARARVSVEICYCSTLGECWVLRSDQKTSTTEECRQCPTPSAITFKE